MSTITGTITIEITNNNPNDGCYRVCYREVGTSTWNCETFTCPTCPTSSPCPCTITLNVNFENETCVTPYEGFVQPCCYPDDKSSGIVLWTADFVPSTRPCSPIKIECTHVRVEGFNILNPISGLNPSNPPVICYVDPNGSTKCTTGIVSNGTVNTATITQSGTVVDTPGACNGKLYVCAHYDTGTSSVVIDSVSATMTPCSNPNAAMFEFGYSSGYVSGGTDLYINLISGGFGFPASGSFSIDYTTLSGFGITNYCACNNLPSPTCQWTISYTSVTGTLIGFMPIRQSSCVDMLPNGIVNIDGVQTGDITPVFDGCSSVPLFRDCPGTSEAIVYTLPINYGESYVLCYRNGLAGLTLEQTIALNCGGYTVTADSGCCYGCKKKIRRCTCSSIIDGQSGLIYSCPKAQAQICSKQGTSWYFRLGIQTCDPLTELQPEMCIYEDSLYLQNPLNENITDNGNCP